MSESESAGRRMGEVHQRIVEDIEQKSPDVRPHQVTFPAGHRIPEGTYEQDADGMWVPVTEEAKAESWELREDIKSLTIDLCRVRAQRDELKIDRDSYRQVCRTQIDRATKAEEAFLDVMGTFRDDRDMVIADHRVEKWQILVDKLLAAKEGDQPAEGDA